MPLTGHERAANPEVIVSTSRTTGEAPSSSPMESVGLFTAMRRALDASVRQTALSRASESGMWSLGIGVAIPFLLAVGVLAPSAARADESFDRLYSAFADGPRAPGRAMAILRHVSSRGRRLDREETRKLTDFYNRTTCSLTRSRVLVLLRVAEPSSELAEFLCGALSQDLGPEESGNGGVPAVLAGTLQALRRAVPPLAEADVKRIDRALAAWGEELQRRAPSYLTPHTPTVEERVKLIGEITESVARSVNWSSLDQAREGGLPPGE